MLTLDFNKVAISIAICVPLLLLAFNLPRISGWLRAAIGVLATEWESDRTTLLYTMLIPLATLSLALATLIPVWTSRLSTMIKGAVTACIALFLLLVIVIHLINVLRLAVRGWATKASSSTSSSSEYLSD